MDRVRTGIDGLDDMLEGGIPRGHAVAVMGSFGTGKTTFGLQFLYKGLLRGEKGIFISLEEDQESILANADSYGWDLRQYINNRKLAVIKLEPTDARNSITRVRSELPEFVSSFGASRIVVDSVSLLNMLYSSDHEKRNNLFNLIQMFKSTGATCIMTAEAQDNNPNASRDGLIEYAVDGVIGLRYEEHSDMGEIKLTIRVMKMRRIKHSRRVRPYSITSNGIDVHSASDVF
ncbi:MAG: KaiC domain-containing protein [Euryarchaeota archaeon]|nr:KaiC domain-containing protein [Euryarchaeota archaeon]